MFNSLSQRNKIKLAVIFVFLLAFLAVNLDFPNIWNKTADKLNKSIPTGIFGREFRYFYNKPFKLGLDLQGGTHLVYEADMSNIKKENRSEALVGVRDVVERRVNFFGVAEPLVQADLSGGHYRLIVELAGVKSVADAIEMIGATPYLEFKEERAETEKEEILSAQEKNERQNEDPYFKSTGLDGRMLKGAEVRFSQNTGQPEILFTLDKEGAKLFGEITKRNINRRVAIYLDGIPISVPRVNEEITTGEARITGEFSIEEAKDLVRNLNAGALPVPIEIISQQTVGATLGKISLDKSLKAGVLGFILIALFMIFYYRLPGILAVFSLAVYGALVLALFKLVPVTLTLAGIAGFILTLGMAVDANVLIFERMKEELKEKKELKNSIEEGFRRAWSSIRDGNTSTLITAVILYGVGVSFVKGFALTLSIGILVSMFTAIVFTRQLLIILANTRIQKFNWIWFKAKND
ncbi:protein translocase subunit SecD [bacterium]|nr:MAG: protein translocase subunit SecD [bacterium]